MFAWSRQELAFRNQVSPSFIPYVIDFEPHVFSKKLTFQVDKGFGYLLRYVTMAWYNTMTGEGRYILGDPVIEFAIQRIDKQTAPVLPAHITTPSAYAECNGGATLSGAHLPALHIGSHKYLNYFYPFGSTVEIRLSREANANDAGEISPAFTTYLVLKGYNVPEPRSRIW